MLKNIYYFYAGIRSLRANLACNSVTGTFAIAPTPAELSQIPVLAAVSVWLDDVYLTRPLAAVRLSSRCIDLEGFARRTRPITKQLNRCVPPASPSAKLRIISQHDESFDHPIFPYQTPIQYPVLLPLQLEHRRSTSSAMVNLPAWPPPSPHGWKNKLLDPDYPPHEIHTSSIKLIDDGFFYVEHKIAHARV
jgi:hypothetical protein